MEGRFPTVVSIGENKRKRGEDREEKKKESGEDDQTLRKGKKSCEVFHVSSKRQKQKQPALTEEQKKDKKIRNENESIKCSCVAGAKAPITLSYYYKII